MLNKSARLKEMVEETESGPVIYTDKSERLITLGTLYYFFDEAHTALEGAFTAISEIKDNYPRDEVTTVLAMAAVEHAGELLSEIFPEGDNKKRKFLVDKEDRKKIIFR